LGSGEDGEVLLRDTVRRAGQRRIISPWRMGARGGGGQGPVGHGSEGWGARRVALAVEEITKPAW
jgi:hypothetical protein